jgi:NADH-quinone oxidoreductase subunit K
MNPLADVVTPSPLVLDGLVVGAILFALGVVGILARRNLIVMFLCTDLMFQAAGVAFIAFSRYWLNHTGETFTIVLITVAAAEAAAAAGFIAALLGRGDVPTFDARELDLWKETPSEKADAADVLAYRDAIRQFPMKLEPQHEPFREHLVHHALWDAYPEKKPQTRTTHGSVIRAMQFAGIKGRRR